MPDLPVIDLRAIEDLRALNPGDNDEFLREIAGIFLDDTPLRIAELDQSLTTGDLSKFARAAHSIKGSSSNLGASALRAAAESLESQARTGGLHGIANSIEQVKTEFARAQTALNSLIAR